MSTDLALWPGAQPPQFETLNGYLFEQGLTAEAFLDELFARETVEAFKI
jgi:hypothetical protein